MLPCFCAIVYLISSSISEAMESQQDIRLSSSESQHTIMLSPGGSSARSPVQTFSAQPSQHDVTPPLHGRNHDLEHGPTTQSASDDIDTEIEGRRKGE